MVNWISGGKKVHTFVCLYCDIRQCPLLSGLGAELIGANFVAPFTGGKWFYNPGAAATIGYWRFDNNAEYVIIALDNGDLFSNGSMPENMIVEVEMLAANTTDRFDYALYDTEGTLLEEVTDITIGSNIKHWHQLGIGFGDHIITGEPLIIVLGIFETNVGGNTTVDIFRIKITYKLGVQTS